MDIGQYKRLRAKKIKEYHKKRHKKKIGVLYIARELMRTGNVDKILHAQGFKKIKTPPQFFDSKTDCFIYIGEHPSFDEDNPEAKYKLHYEEGVISIFKLEE